MASGKGEEQNKGKVVKIARLALGAGLAWGVFRFIQARREEDALIREYYGDRADFFVPDSEHSDDEDEYLAISPSAEQEKEDIQKVEVVKVRDQDIALVPSEQHCVEEKQLPWFSSIFSPQKAKQEKPVLQDKGLLSSSERSYHEISKGDTLWAISRRYGVSLESLKASNGLHADDIFAGEKLVIPKH